MPIKLASEGDFDRILYMATYCFPWLHQSYDKMAIYAKKYVKPEYVLGYYGDDDVLTAAIQMLPYSIVIGGAPLDMGGIAMVSSMPEGRHGGRIASLLRKSLEIMKERGQSVSMLGPFSFEFYRKYGWEHGFDRLDYEVPIEHIKPFSKRNGTIKPASGHDIDALNEIYLTYAIRHNGCTVRDRTIWTDFVMDDPFSDEYKRYTYIWYYDDGRPGGYIIYIIRDGKMSIHEMIYEDIEALQGLLWFIYAHEAQISAFTWSTATDDLLRALLPNPRINAKIVSGMMFRVVDVEKALQGRGYSDGVIEDFTIRIDDPNAPWNEGPWLIHVEDGHAEVSRSEAASLSCNIQTFSQMFLGYLSPFTLAALGRIIGDEQALASANAVFTPSPTFNNNGF